jgi:sugar phosphate isomerase/epimerase
MNYQVYLKKRGRWRRLLRYVEQAGVPYVLEVERLDTSKSPITAALEFREKPPEALTLPRVGEEEFDWYVMFADALDVRRLVLPPPPALQAAAAIYDKAVEYGIEVNWIYGTPPMTRPVDVEQVARSIRPTAAKIVYDPVKAKGTKEIYRTIVTLSGYIREIYLSNRRGERGPRLPPFDPIGRINFVEILQALYLIQWEGRITIRQAAQFFDELDLQLRIGSEVLETTRSVGVSKKVQRRVAEVLNELMQ